MVRKHFDNPSVFEIDGERLLFDDCRRVCGLHGANRDDELWKTADRRFAFITSGLDRNEPTAARWYEARWGTEEEAISFAKERGKDVDEVLWKPPPPSDSDS